MTPHTLQFPVRYFIPSRRPNAPDALSWKMLRTHGACTKRKLFRFFVRFLPANTIEPRLAAGSYPAWICRTNIGLYHSYRV